MDCVSCPLLKPKFCRMKLLLALFGAFLVPLLLVGQGEKISGIVTDASTGEPLFAATVLAGDVGTSTEFDGSFSLVVQRGVDQLKVSYVGYTTQQINLTDQREYFIDLHLSDNLLQTAVVTGSKYEQSIGESIVSIDVIKPTLLKSTNTNNVEEIFNKIPGVQMIDGQPNIRGGSGWSYNAGNRVMLLIDDIPALQPDAGRAQWSDIPVENIAQIEVIKGAGSTLYGSAAMNGVINIRTAYATATPETQFSLFSTVYDNYKDERKNWFRRGDVNHTPMDIGMSASHKQKFGKWDVVVAGYYFEIDSTKSYRDQDFRYKARGNLNLRYRATDKITFGVNSIVNKGRSSSFFLWKNGSSGALQPFAGTVTRSGNLRFTIDPFITIYDKKNNKHRFQGRYYYGNNDNNLNQSNKAIMSYGEYQFQKTFDSDLNMVAGLVGSRVTSDSEFFDNADIYQINYAGFIQLDKKIGERLSVSGGGRYEFNKQKNDLINHTTIAVPAGEQSEGQFIGRFGANYKVSEGTFLRTSIGQAYRFPILIERFLSTEFGGFVILPNPDLNSERGVTTEIGLKQGFQLGSFQGYTDIAFFNSQYTDMMEFVFVSTPLFGFQSQNIGDTKIQGIEISLAGNGKIGSIPVTFYGGYNYSDPKYQDFSGLEDFLNETSSTNENVLKYRSRHSFSMDLQSNIDKFMFGVAVQGASHVLAIDKILETFIPDLESYRDFDSNGYQIFDARVGYSLGNMDIAVHLKNILNQEYTQRPGIIQAPRNIALRLDYNL